MPRYVIRQTLLIIGVFFHVFPLACELDVAGVAVEVVGDGSGDVVAAGLAVVLDREALTVELAGDFECQAAVFQFEVFRLERAIAEANGVNPNYAMNLFRQTFGTTMSHFITEHRIAHAQRLLVTSDETILKVAFAAGFQSLSRFNEAFKAACGCSPRDYRKAHHAERS